MAPSLAAVRVGRLRLGDRAGEASKRHKSPSSRASPATSSTSPCSAASRPRPKKLGATVNTQGPAEVRPDPAEADRRLGRGLQAGRHPDRPHRRRGHAGAAGGGRRGRHQGRPRRHHGRGPVVRGVADRLRQHRRRRGGLQGHQAAQPRRRQGAGHLHRPRHLHRRRPGQGLRGGGQGRPDVQVPRRAVQPQRPGHGGQARHRRPAEGPRHRRRLRDQHVLRRGHRHRRPPGRQAGPGQDRRLRRRARPGQAAARTAPSRRSSPSSPADIGADGVEQAVAALNGGRGHPEDPDRVHHHHQGQRGRRGAKDALYKSSC